jgi:hypothetical protein
MSKRDMIHVKTPDIEAYFRKPVKRRPKPPKRPKPQPRPSRENPR